MVAEEDQKKYLTIVPSSVLWYYSLMELSKKVWTPSGKWVQRVSKKLHRQLKLIAERDGVSLNRLVEYFLVDSVAREKASFGIPRDKAKVRRSSSAGN